MDYLVIEGYKDAAECFAKEAGISPQVDLDSIANRMTIRSAIQRGDIEEAIGRVNELDPEVSLQTIIPVSCSFRWEQVDAPHKMTNFMHHAEEPVPLAVRSIAEQDHQSLFSLILTG